jgi:hypothetical protein
MRRLMAMLGWGVLLLGVPARGAGLAVQGPVYDFGFAEQGTTVVHQFPLKNTGRTTIRIEDVHSSCGCTAAAAEGKTLAPGQIAWLAVRLDTTDLVGKTTKRVTVHTSDSRTPEVLLAMTGTVLTDLVVTPTPLYLGHVWRGSQVRQELRVSTGRPMAPGSTAYTVSSVETDSWALRAYVQAGDKPGEMKLVVELDPEVPAGRFNDRVIIHTTSPRQPVITVPVFGDIMGWG